MAGRSSHRKKRKGFLGLASGVNQGSGRVRLTNWTVVIIAIVVMVAAITKASHRDPVIDILQKELDEQLSSREIRASFSFEAVDLELTRLARETAESAVPDHYRVNTTVISEQLQALDKQVEWLASKRPGVSAAILKGLGSITSLDEIDSAVSKSVQQYVKGILGSEEGKILLDEPTLMRWLTPDKVSLPKVSIDMGIGDADIPTPAPIVRLEPDDPSVLEFEQSDQLARLAREGLAIVLRKGVRQQNLLPQDSSRTIALLREASDGEGTTKVDILYESVMDRVGARESLASVLPELATAQGLTGGADQAAEDALPVAAAFLTDTLRFDKAETESARHQASVSVNDVTKHILASEEIQDGGRRWTEQSRSDGRAYLKALQGDVHPVTQLISASVAHLILVVLTLLCLYRSIELFRDPNTTDTMILFRLALLLMGGLLVLSRISSYFEPTGFLVPVAACGILYAILVNVGLAAVVSFLTATLVSVQYGYDWRLVMVGTAMSLAGVYGIFRVRRRSDMASASMTATFVGGVMMVAVVLATDSLLDERTVRLLFLIVLNGAICLLAVPAVLSPLERLFGFTTDIQLLEYSDFNNELLARLAVEAPGTSAHSRMLGDLAEAAADAIGANGLLARVSAYYHDIGKMRRSTYFSENQTGYNVHDELSPRMSARAIAAHVIQGAELARENHLPKPILDGILEHHGTCLIGYFYQQAKKEQKHGDVLEEDFRYPGPKPQRPETAILMICDAVESGVRSIKNPTEERVRDFVDKIVAARSADRQFDDCNLTLKQLDTIAEVVAQRIVSNLHTRVAYPSAREEDNVDNIVPMAGNAE